MEAKEVLKKVVTVIDHIEAINGNCVIGCIIEIDGEFYEWNGMDFTHKAGWRAIFIDKD
jgi:hypothetical protein